MDSSITLAICTYNRSELLARCIESISLQTENEKNIEVLVIDNASSISEQQNNKKISDSAFFVRYIYEKKPGLSRARNRALKESKCNYLGFLDDDSIPGPGFINRACQLSQSGRYDAFGGHIESDWYCGRPKWLDKNFGSKPLLSKDITVLTDQYLWGGNMFFRKELLISIGGFNEKLGIRGDTRAYGAENDLQQRIRLAGGLIIYDPDLLVFHKVLPQKLKWEWHIFWAYATARDGKLFFKDQYRIVALVKSLIHALLEPLISLFLFMTKKDFYWQNLLINSLQPWAKFIGKIKARIRGEADQ